MAEKKKPCKKCGSLFPASDLSRRGLCGFCGYTRWSDAVGQMRMRKGPIYDKWLRSYLASMQATITKLRKETEHDELPF